MFNPLRRYPIEILIVLWGLAGSLMGPALGPQGRLKIMREYESELREYADPTVVDELIQQKLVLWQDYSTAVWTPVAMLTVAFLGAWSDIHGRQINMLLGSTVLAMALVEADCLYSNSLDFPLWTSLASTFVSALIGSGEVGFTAASAYLSDATADKERLPVRLAVILVLSQVTGFGGSMLALLYSRRFYVLDFLLLPFALIVLGFYYTLVFVPQIPPAQLTAARLRRGGDHAGAEAVETALRLETAANSVSARRPLSMLKQRFALAWRAFAALFRPRDHGKRAILVAVLLLNFIGSLAASEQGKLLSVVLVRRQFHFQSDSFGLYGAVRTVASGIGMVAGVLVMKRWLKFRDTSIILVAMVARAASTAVMVFASAPWHVYLSQAVGALGAASGPVGFAFVTRLVDADEVGKLFSLFVVMDNVANVLDQYVLQTVYTFTLDWFAGFVWLIVVAMQIVAFLLMLFVHRYAIRQEIEHAYGQSHVAAQADAPT